MTHKDFVGHRPREMRVQRELQDLRVRTNDGNNGNAQCTSEEHEDGCYPSITGQSVDFLHEIVVVIVCTFCRLCSDK